MKIGDVLTKVGRPVAYHPRLAEAVGGVTTGVLLDQLLYWRGKGKTPESVYKTADEIRDETGLTYREQLSARKRLRTLGILAERYDRLHHTTYFTVDLEALEGTFQDWLDSNGERRRVVVTPKRGHKHSHLTSVGNVEKRRSGKTLNVSGDGRLASVEDRDSCIDFSENTTYPPSPPPLKGERSSVDGLATFSTPRKRFEKKAERDARLEEHRREVSRQADAMSAASSFSGSEEMQA